MGGHGDRPADALFPAILSPVENRNMKHEIQLYSLNSRAIKHEICLIIISNVTLDNLENSTKRSFLRSSAVIEPTLPGL